MLGPIRLVPQRTDHDCAVSCLASVTGRSYEQTLMAFRHPVYAQGSNIKQLRDAARRLGFVATWSRSIDLEADAGILVVQMPAIDDKSQVRDHVVVLFDGLVVDLEEPMSVWDVDDYLKAFNARTLSIVRIRQLAKENT